MPKLGMLGLNNKQVICHFHLNKKKIAAHLCLICVKLIVLRLLDTIQVTANSE